MTDREAQQPAAEDDEALSALMDGDATESGLIRTCRHWRHDERLRRDWHAYHVIGDVLRSEELADHAAADERFLQTLRSRLAQEPVVLAPILPTIEPALDPSAATGPAQVLTLPSRRAGLRRWGAPIGIAAGVMLVASAVMVTRPDGPTPSGLVAAVSQPATPEPAPTLLPDRQRAQAAQFDPYFSAHQQFQNATAIGPASSFLRSAAYEAGEAR
jgi:sigma-E factor negative regulatory protein RseA